MAVLKQTTKRIIVAMAPLLRFAVSWGYSPRYIRGKYFEQNVVGWRWLLEGLLYQKILRINAHVPWPVTAFSRISSPAANMVFDVDDMHIFQSPGCYFQCFAERITIGRGVYIAPNVGLITANHDTSDLAHHSPGSPITIGDDCWIGMNAVLLPGVELGPKTIVAAGAVVTKSFHTGHCVLAGVPARVVKTVEQPRSNTADGEVASAPTQHFEM